jgi:hypothetical protein
MNWEAIGAVGEIVGALAVVVTLAYLAIQIRQTNRIARAESYGKIIDAHVGHHRALYSRPEMIGIWRRGLSNYRELNQDEQGLFHTFIGPIVLEFQKYLYLYRQGLIPEGTFQMFENDTVASLLSPGGRQWWDVSKGKWPEVREYLDRRIVELEGNVTPSHLDFGGFLNQSSSD